MTGVQTCALPISVDPLQTAAAPLPVFLGDGQPHRPPGGGGGEKVQHRHRVPPVEAGGLGHIADEGPGPPHDRPVGQADGGPPRRGKCDAPGVGQLAQDAAEQGGLARPVGADEGFPLQEKNSSGKDSNSKLSIWTQPVSIKFWLPG